jgi:DNA processing protein
MTSEKSAWIYLNYVSTLGPVRLHRLLEKWPSAKTILQLSSNELQAAGISRDLADSWSRQFRSAALAKELEDELRRAERGEFQIITEIDAEYPTELANFLDRPPVLYVQGRWPLTGPGIGIVGTRGATRYGTQVAADFTRDLVQRGLRTVSGLAAGIDTVVHRTTLEEAGETTAVLGHGFGFMYPKENQGLYKEVMEKGTVVTEFPFHCSPKPGQFPRRNRIISGLSKAVLVVEAPPRSGALVTARYAAEQGREVFAVPGPISQEQSAGCHRLIQDGARLVMNSGDVLEALGAQRSTEPDSSAAVRAVHQKVENLSSFEKRIYMSLENVPVSVEELASLLKAPVDQLANALLSLELMGLISMLPGQRYARANS